jgi:hypothetical protein
MNARLFVGGAALAALLAVDAAASPLPTTTDLRLPDAAVEAQAFPRTREFRRCMRAKYGPRYFARVPRAVRFHMAQACGG